MEEKTLKKVLLALAAFLLTLMCSGTPTVKADTLTGPQIWQVAVNQIAMYIVPDETTRKIDVLSRNDLCTITEIQTDADGELWGRTSNGNGTGWIRRSLCVKISENEKKTTGTLLNVETTNSNGPASYSETGYYQIAHRGSHTGDLQDNTLEAFEQAGKEGYWGIETDLKIYNGEMVICHDTPDDTCPLFSDYLDICKEYGCVALIDIKGAWGTKYADKLAAAVDLVAEKGMTNQVIWQSSVIKYLTAIDNYAPEVHRCVLAASATTLENALANAQLVHADSVNIAYGLGPSLEYLEEMRDYGLTIIFYQFSSLKQLDKIKSYNPTYILTKSPI